MGLTEEDAVKIGGVLKDIDFLKHLSPRETEILIAGFEKTPMKAGDTLITQGKSGAIFYIIASGIVGVFLKRQLMDKKVATLVAGQYFGEMALLDDEPRSASVKCEKDGEVFTLLRDTFQTVIMHNLEIGREITATAKKRKVDTHNIDLNDSMQKKFR